MFICYEVVVLLECYVCCVNEAVEYPKNKLILDCGLAWAEAKFLDICKLPNNFK
jgi:hypothetical protein